MKLENSSMATQAVHQRSVDFLTGPFKRFARIEASAGILLLLCATVALGLANSPWSHSYHSIWEAEFTVGQGSLSLTQSYHHWINDGLMSIFFFLMGMEIKREILAGELSTPKLAAFPFVAALGGSCVPTAVFLLVARSSEVSQGWAIPMATDIAFTLGVLALLGKSVPAVLKIFVTALAIVDDIFGVLVIAFFYTVHISILSLVLTVLGLATSCMANWLGIRKPVVYGVIGVLVWLAVLKSGVHATIAGVLMAFTIPASSPEDRASFLRSSRSLLDGIEATEEHSVAEHDMFQALESQSICMQSPLHRIEHSIQPWISFLIMPLFALANTGVHVGNISEVSTNRVVLAVALGLLLGKAAGISSFAWLAVKLGIASLPQQVNWKQVFGASCLCGIGFTMSLFIAGLAFEKGELLDMAKIGILAGSASAGVVGTLILKRTHTTPGGSGSVGQDASARA
jgi:Na+:H+ antiporter, NhaA family